jgi:glycerol-3-phosphate dehydrogenase
VGGLPRRECSTAELRLHGSTDQRNDERLTIYGTDAPALVRLIESNPDLGESLHPRLPYRAAEVIWAAREEAARTVEDVLARRTRALFLDARASLEAAPRVAALLAAELTHQEPWQSDQVGGFEELASLYVPVGVED